jgi:hypothetical protein
MCHVIPNHLSELNDIPLKYAILGKQWLAHFILVFVLFVGTQQ